jgi:hypothetical protein
MSGRDRKPLWWPLFVLLPLTVGTLLLESKAVLPVWGHRVAQIGIVVLFFVLAGLFVHMNEGPMMWDEARDVDSRMARIIYVSESQQFVENGLCDSNTGSERNARRLEQYLPTLPPPHEFLAPQQLRASLVNGLIALGEDRSN